MPYRNYSLIDKRLAVGAAPFEPSELVGMFDAILDCQMERLQRPELMRQHGFRYHHLPMGDGVPFGDTPAFIRAVDWVTQQRVEGKRCLIHCLAGVNRSVVVAAGVLM